MFQQFNKISFIAILLIIFLAGCHGKEEEEHNDEGHHSEGITLHEEEAEKFGILVAVAEAAPFYDVIKTTGSIQSSFSDVYTLTARKSGIVKLSSGITEGGKISKGAGVAVITSEGMQGGDVTKVAEANLNHARAEYERLKPLYEEGLVTASVFREAERAYNEARAVRGSSSSGSETISSPADGYIQSLMVRSGEYVDAGQPIAVVSKNSEMMLKALLPVSEISHLPEIETANFIPEGSEETIRIKEHNGRMISSSGSSQAENGYLPVYFSFSGNPLSTPGGYAEVYLICGEKPGVISVPRTALIEVQGNKYIYVGQDDETFEKRLVVTGAGDGERIEIKSGLNPGENYVAKGASVMRMVELSSVAPPAHTHSH